MKEQANTVQVTLGEITLSKSAVNDIATQIIDKLSLTPSTTADKETFKEVMSVEETARYLNLSRQTIYNKVSSGSFMLNGSPVYVRKFNKIFFNTALLNKWVLEEK